ncbi:MAG: sensor domain-containing protein [Hyphomicrobiales bacterium]
MTEPMTGIAQRGTPPPRPGGPPPRIASDWYLGVFLRPQTYLNIAYLLLAFPLGVAYFVALVTLVALGGGLAVTLVGLPLLVGTMYAWCYVARFESALANRLLGTHISSPAFAHERQIHGAWERIRARLANPLTWRIFAFLLLRFPLGVASFVLVTALISIPVQMITLPFTAELGSDGAMNFGFWRIDHWYEGAIFTPLGIVLLPLAFHAINGAAFLSGQVARGFLGQGGEAPAPTGEGIERAARAAFHWQGLRFTGQLTPDEVRTQWTQLRVFGWHSSVAFFLSFFFLVTNGLTTPDVWWSLYVIWGLAFPLAMHGGYLLRGFFGLHVGLFKVTNLGLFIIDAAYSDNWWFYWPLLAWLPFIALHWFIDQKLRGRTAEPAAAAPAPAALLPAIAETTAGAGAPSAQPEPTTGGSDPGHLRYDAPEQSSEGETPQRGIHVDIEMRRVTVDGEDVELTPKEFDLLALFTQNPGRPFSRDELLDRIWKNEYEVTDRTVDTHIQRLRKKLGPQSEAIQTVWGIGYRYQR